MFKRQVEVGRVVLLNFGDFQGKLATIVDIIDHNRVLVDGPSTGVPRMEFSLKRCVLTQLKVAIPRAIGTKKLEAVLKKADILATWSKSAWAKKLAVREVRKNLSDFDRFKVMVARKQRRAIVGKQFAKLRKATAPKKASAAAKKASPKK